MISIANWLIGLLQGDPVSFSDAFYNTFLGKILLMGERVIALFTSIFNGLSFLPSAYIVIIGYFIIVVIVLRIVGR